ncbi:GNAT family N-acetyltransferase [candidate division KSB1 bacterium]|nr:GNAT family N-acetyltransferase [candidate division KSB1 bacterium]
MRDAPLEELPDEELMLAYAAGDAGAFAQLYDRHERAVYRFLLRSVRSPESADDLLQDTWMAVVRNAAGYAPRARFTTWLYGIARSKLIDHWRRTDPAASLDDPVANDPDSSLVDHIAADAAFQPEVQALSRAQARAFVDAVEALPPAQREAFLRMQFRAQQAHHQKYYADAQFQVILHNAEPIGRLYIAYWKNEIRVVDIALLPAYRGQGYGAAILTRILSEGEEAGLPVRIHVEKFNPALRLYERLGFRPIEDKGVYWFMEWRAEAEARDG